jgi:hypothetical protein
MTFLPFLLFSVLVMGVLYLHFALAHWAWRKLRHQPAPEIDTKYVRIEDYFAQSFRHKLEQWLKAPAAVAPTGEFRRIRKHGEWIMVCGSANYPANSENDEILALEGDFTCGGRCTFNREIHSRGSAAVGVKTRLQAIAVEGTLRLKSGTRVMRWADSAGAMTLEGGVLVRSRVTSRTSIELAQGARVLSAFAPEVTTPRKSDAPEPPATSEEPALEIPAPGLEGRHPLLQKMAGFDPDRLTAMGPECWAYHGHFRPDAVVRIKSKIVVHGNCSCPAGSILEDDVKAAGTIHLGPRSVAKGSLVAILDVILGPGCVFESVIHAGRTARLSTGVRGVRRDMPVAAYGKREVCLEDDVVVQGKVASLNRVIAVVQDPSLHYPKPAPARPWARGPVQLNYKRRGASFRVVVRFRPRPFQPQPAASAPGLAVPLGVRNPQID